MKKSEELGFELDMDAIKEVLQIQTPVAPLTTVETGRVQRRAVNTNTDETELINCLRNERIEVRFIPQSGKITDKAHPMWGGLGENSKIIISVPRLKSGSFANVLTNSEKKYLEYIMGLEDNALSVYNRQNNYWSNNTEGGISKVILFKRDNYLDLSDPEDYIRYKILLADKEHIAPNIQTYQDKPKATYKFVLVSDSETNAVTRTKFSSRKQAYIEYGKIENNYNTLKAILEMLTLKPVSKNVKLEYLLDSVQEYLDDNPKEFLQIIKDPYLDTKILIKRAVDAGLISKRANYYYLRSTNEPLCDAGEEATLSVAAAYLASPRLQETKLSIEGRLNLQ